MRQPCGCLEMLGHGWGRVIKVKTMNLFLMRHGDAAVAYPDNDRCLSEQGLQEVDSAAQQLLKRKVHIACIYHSRMLRTQQTAEILAKHLQVKYIKKAAGLLPTDAVDNILRKIPTWTENTLLVTHLPYLQRLMIALAADDSLPIEFNTATIVCLKQVSGKWEVDFTVTA